ncbi:hypothetical protein [Acinetobacter sp. A2]
MTQTIELNQLKQYNLITYILYLVGFVVGITGLCYSPIKMSMR